jgi:hypothetical protein
VLCSFRLLEFSAYSKWHITVEAKLIIQRDNLIAPSSLLIGFRGGLVFVIRRFMNMYETST